MLKVGLLGVGHLGKFHLEQWLNVKEAELVGFYDTDLARCQEISTQYDIPYYEDMNRLMDDSHAIDIVTPTLSHFDLAKKAIKKSKHIFLEKPISHSLEEAEELMALVKESGVKCQIGHIERFNPAILSISHIKLNPKFVETHRLAQFNPRGTDVSVVLDLMIHDLDIILAMVGSGVKNVTASGVAVVSENYDIANARLEFENGCVANLTASRISLKNMRKTRLFQKDAYIALDFLSKKSEVVRFENEEGQDTTKNGLIVPIKLSDQEQKNIILEYPTPPDTNAIQLELTAFTNSILNDEKTLVNVEDGYNALALAYRIIDQIEANHL